MIAEKKKQVQILLVLGLVLALAMFYTYRTSYTPATGGAATPAEKAARAAALPSAGNAQIRLDLITAKLDKDVVGRRNVFQYYVPPPPPKPPAPPPPVYTPPPSNNNNAVRPPVVPTAPFSALSNFKFDAVGIVAKPGKLMASIKEGETNRWNVTEGEYIQGRYRINRITENSVEIEDVDQNRRQTYTRQTQ